MEQVRVFGLPNCDTCRKARKALAAAGYDVTFVDVRETPPGRDALAGWLESFGPGLLNTRSTTWRGLSEAERAADPVELLAVHPALMKRPVIVGGGRQTLGWDAAAQAAWA